MDRLNEANVDSIVTIGFTAKRLGTAAGRGWTRWSGKARRVDQAVDFSYGHCNDLAGRVLGGEQRRLDGWSLCVSSADSSVSLSAVQDVPGHSSHVPSRPLRITAPGNRVLASVSR